MAKFLLLASIYFLIWYWMTYCVLVVTFRAITRIYSFIEPFT